MQLNSKSAVASDSQRLRALLVLCDAWTDKNLVKEMNKTMVCRMSLEMLAEQEINACLKDQACPLPFSNFICNK